MIRLAPARPYPPPRVIAVGLLVGLTLAGSWSPILGQTVPGTPGASPGVAETAEPVPMVRGNAAGTGEHPGPAPEGALQEAWNSATGRYAEAPPIVAGGVVYAPAASEPRLYALDAATGRERWTRDGIAPVAPVVDGGTVYAVTGEQEGPRTRITPTGVAAIDAATGSERRWSLPVEGLDDRADQRLVLSDGRLFVPTERSLLAVDVDRGELAWEYPLPEATALGEVAAADGTVVVRLRPESRDVTGSLVALDAARGTARWDYRAAAGTSFEAGPMVADGAVYLAGTGGVAALDLADGREVWTTPVGDADATISEAVIADGALIGFGSDSAVYAIDLESRSLRWEYAIVGSFDVDDFGLVAADGLVFVDIDDAPSVHAVDTATGEGINELALDDDERNPQGLAVTGGTIYANVGEGIAAFRGSGAPAGIRSPIAGNTYTSPANRFSLTWDDAWQPIGEDAGGDEDVLFLAHGDPASSDSGVLILRSGALPGTSPAACAEGLAESPSWAWLAETGEEGLAPAPDLVPASGLPDDAGAAAVTLAPRRGASADDYLAGLMVCVPLDPGASMLLLEFYAPEAAYPAERDAFLELLDGLEVAPGD
jgi:outer membrane protein assembly factor BamB